MLGALSACSSSKPPPKIAPNGEYMGWHCGVDPTAASNWRCDKKVFIDGTIVTAETAVESKVDIQPSSSPMPVTPVVRSSEPKSETQFDSTPETISQSEPQTADSMSGYGLQLGAYASRQKAEQIAQSMILDEDIQIRGIMSNGRVLWVILMGPYPTRGDAEIAAQPLVTNYWIRSMRSLANAAVK
jgi:septal ring-binding cell division protein DamX